MEVKLSKKQIQSYDGAVRWWFEVKEQVQGALELMGISAPKLLWRAYWSAHQRFFREMCIAAKVDDIAKQAREYMRSDHAIVIGLQTTGEAGLEVALEELAEALETNDAKDLRRSDSGKIDFEDLEFPSLVSTCASIMSNFVRNHFPIAFPPPEPPKIPPIPSAGASDFDKAEYLRITELAERISRMPDPEPIPELLERRRNMLESIRLLDLPPNPLDDIIDRLGGEDNVAEMTGRSGRVLRDKKSGMCHYAKRFGGASKQKSYGLSMPVSREDENDRLNIVEKRKFMQGKKSVAIISDAASTGISLHADRRSEASHKRRVHFTIELPWAADKAIQQLGRSHRSGQKSAPIYKMVVTELGGERRFAAAVSKRMAQLGALTKGDRRAATGTDLSDFDIDSLFGRRALTRLYNNLREPPASAPSRNTNTILDEFLAIDDIASRFANQERDEATKRADALQAASEALGDVGLIGEPVVKMFLNRIAGLDVARQNLVFSLFMSTLDDVIADAKVSGEWEGSVEDVKATSISVKGTPKVIATDASCGADTALTMIELDRGVSFGQIIEQILEDVDNSGANTERGESSGGGEEDEGSSDDERSYDPDAPAESGFYRSRRKIAGRHLILFAQRQREVADAEDADFIDPLASMIVTRPNTGKNPCSTSSRDLKHKYDLLISSAELVHLLRQEEDEDDDKEGGGSLSDEDEKKDEERCHTCTSTQRENADPVTKLRVKLPKIASMWDEAYKSSDHSEHNKGLAPRRSEMGLITGAVLHILPALEKAVAFVRNAQQRSLRVMRVEITGTGRRIVGIRFPTDDVAIGKLMETMKDVSAARKGSLDAPSYVDDAFSPIDEKAMSWATTERKTMKSFFGAAAASKSSALNGSSSNLSRSSNASTSSKRKQPSFVSSQLQNTTSSTASKRVKSTSTGKTEGKKKTSQKTQNISSFFTKKG